MAEEEDGSYQPCVYGIAWFSGPVAVLYCRKSVDKSNDKIQYSCPTEEGMVTLGVECPVGLCSR